MKKRLAATVLAFFFATSSVFGGEIDVATPDTPAPIFTHSKPAVDGLNGELWMYSGAGLGNAQSMSPIPGLAVARHPGSNVQGITGGAGVLTAPIGHDFGLQIDLNTGSFEKAVQGGAAGHFFWRDPEDALIGVYGSGSIWAGYGGKSNWNIGPELEKYFDDFTIGGNFGIQGFDFYNVKWDAFTPLQSQRTACNHQPLRFFDNISLKYYPTDDLMLLVGHTYTKGIHAVRVGAEWIPEQFRGKATATALFIDGAYGQNKSSSVMAGIKVYFGNHDKSLKRRHREDDPENIPSPNLLADLQRTSTALSATRTRMTPPPASCGPKKLTVQDIIQLQNEQRLNELKANPAPSLKGLAEEDYRLQRMNDLVRQGNEKMGTNYPQIDVQNNSVPNPDKVYGTLLSNVKDNCAVMTGQSCYDYANFVSGIANYPNLIDDGLRGGWLTLPSR